MTAAAQPPIAIVVVPAGTTAGTAVREAGLATQKLPEQLETVDALPRNETLRKVLKYKLRERFAKS